MAIAAADTAGRRADRIESLLSARLFVEPQLVDDRITFVSNLSGHLSLYAMDASGGVPEPLLPPQIALQNPELVGGKLFRVVRGLGRIVVMIDSDGDENYVPYTIPVEGGFPEALAPETFSGGRSHLLHVDDATDIAYFAVESREEASTTAVRVDLASGAAESLWQSSYGAFVAAWTPDHSRVALVDGYTIGDVVLYEVDDGRAQDALRNADRGARSRAGLPALGLSRRVRNRERARPAHDDDALRRHGHARVLSTSPGRASSIRSRSTAFATEASASSKASTTSRATATRSSTTSTAAPGRMPERSTRARAPSRSSACSSARASSRAASSTASTSTRRAAASSRRSAPRRARPSSTCSPPTASPPVSLTRERALGLAPELLSAGEDASFESHDGLRVSARLYLPSPELGYDGPRPLVYYVHGGPQSQERPDFAWFSMPLIQILTLEGFAVFVPNARGSTGYGLDYAKQVDRDWGGLDRLDHVHAMTEVLSQDERVDASRAGVVGRSYGGYMTLTLAARHPELWRAAVDMFGPYDLFTFMDRLPETWKPYFALAVGDPENDRDFLIERSPKTHIADIACPLLVIQGQNDPRVVERESRDVVEQLRGLGRDVDYLVFEDEGHDVLKLANRVRCYDTIVGFFAQHLS